MTIQLLEELADRSIVRNWIWHRKDSFEPEMSGIVTRHDCSAIWSTSVGVLHVVEPFGIGLPNIDLYSVDRPPFHVFDGAHHKERLTVWVLRYPATMSARLGFVRVKGSKDGAFRAVLRFRMVDRVDQQRKTQDVGKQDKLLEALSHDIPATREGAYLSDICADLSNFG